MDTAAHFRQHWKLVFSFLLVCILSITVSIVGPDTIMASIGEEHGYMLLFGTALIGTSVLFSGSFYVTLVALASTGDYHPVLMALASAPALIVGDALFFIIGRGSRAFLSTPWLTHVSHWMRGRIWIPLTGAYLYSACTPLPQDILMLALGIARMPFWRTILVILVGNITFITLVATGVRAINA